MRAMVLKLRGIPLAGDADHKPEVPAAPGLHSRERILDDDRSRRLNRQQLCGHQKGIRGGFARQVLRVDRVAIDSYLEEGIELGGLQDGRAVLTRGDDGNFESAITELTDESDASLIRLHPNVFDNLVDQLVLAVPKPADRFDLRGIVRATLWELDSA